MTEDDDITQNEDSGSNKNFIFGGIACIVIGLGLAAYFIGLPIYHAKNQSESEITLYDKAIGGAIILPLIGVAMLLFKEKVFEWIPTEDNQKITLKHIIYLTITVAIFLLLYFQIVGYLETLGYKDSKGY
jgi:hypothetical protein